MSLWRATWLRTETQGYRADQRRGTAVNFVSAGLTNGRTLNQPTMKCLLCCLSVLAAASLTVGAEPRLNVLFIMADDYRPEVASYGSRALTPNLDRLARRAVQFDRAYCQQAVCNPSRSSLLTGLRPERSGFGTTARIFGR